MKITESQLRKIVREEARKVKLNESQNSADELLFNAMEEYIDQMTLAGFGYDDICGMMKDNVDGFCEQFLENLAPEDRDPMGEPGSMGEPDDRWEKANLKPDEYGPAYKRR